MQQQANYLQQLLVSLRTRLLVMCASVGIALEDAGKAMAAGDPGRAASVIENDAAVDALENEIDEMALQLLARTQPVAKDLRFVVSALRMVVDLERIGDEIKKAALKAHELIDHSRAVASDFYDFNRMCGQTITMLRRALDAFARIDTSALLELIEADKQLDHDYRSSTRSRVTYMMEDPRTISTSIDLMFMNKAIERVGDHAVNIAEHVVYLAKGIDVRHTSVEVVKEALSDKK